MTLKNDILRNIRRTVLCLALMLCTTINTAAQGAWDGKTAVRPAGLGSIDNPCLIVSAENLYHVAKDPGSYEGKYLKQMSDIDLGGFEWTPIGTNGAPFKGIYDGMGYTIKGLKVDWGNYARQPGGGKNANHYAYGLFGYFMGSVENLVIDGAEIYQSDPTKQMISSNDLRVGILIGAVGCTEGGYIRNILIRNSKITSNPANKEKSGNYFIAQAYMIGGLVGDIHAKDSYTSTTEVKENFTIENICVSADFELGNIILDSGRTFSNKGLQFYVGGLVGRARSVHTKHMPKNVLYSGNIDAPYAMVGPILGGARAKGGNTTNNITVNTYDGTVNSYAGDFWDKANGSADLTNAFYYDFKIQNYSDGSAEGVTALIDNATLNANDKGTHTLKAQEAFTFDIAHLTAVNTAMFQGVNRGTFKDMTNATTRTDVLTRLNTGNGTDFRFVWRNNHVELQGKEEMMSLERKNIYLFQATMRNLKADVAYTYKWTISDKNGQTWSSSCLTSANPATSQSDSQSERVLKIVSVDKTTPSCAVIGGNRPYNYIKLEVYDGATLIASQGRDIGDVRVSVERGVYTIKSTKKVTVTETDDMGNQYQVEREIETVTKDHFLFTADIEIEGHHFATDTDFFEGVSCEWKVLDKTTNTFVPIESSGYIPTGYATERAVAHLQSDYVGELRFTAISHNSYDNSDVAMTNSVVNGMDVNYIQQVITGLNLSMTMEEYCGVDANGNILTQPFDPSHYHINPAAGRNGFYDYNNTTYSAGLLDDENAAVIKPLIFKVKVVDQFGNEWTSAANALERFRVQWNYRISGEGADVEKNGEIIHQRSENYDYEGGAADGNYNLVNGRFKAGTADYGLQVEVPVTTVKDYIPRTGQYKLIGDSILIIHPNILHRTSAFWVRTRLFDIVNDPEGNHPSETVLAFNQLGIKLTKNNSTNTIDGKVLWRLDPNEAPYVSGTSNCDLIWYRSADPTAAPDKWEKIQESKGVFSRETTLRPNLYNPRYFYKLYYKSGFNLEAEEIIGPQNVIFVYDRAMTNANIERTDFNPYDQQTNQYYPTGLNINHGHDPYHAVTTMAQAYSMLDKNGSAEENVIVVMGYMEDKDYLLYSGARGDYSRNATIAGAFGNVKGSTLWLSGENTAGRKLGGSTIFKDLTLHGGDEALHFYCALNDVTFDTGLKMKGYKKQTANGNGIGNYEAPQITIIGGFHNHNNASLPYPERNATQGMTTMTFRSGTFGRIISGARTHGGYNKTSFNTFGHPEWPHRVKVVVDIKEDRPEADQATYHYDIGLLVGGQTDGTLYTESEIEMRNGSVGRYISGNISYGRSVGDAHPADSFFGSTTLNLYGGQIVELFGGTLGRHEATSEQTDKCDAYFYGRSIINVYDGTISSNIYGAGAGGVFGLGNDANHTNDPMIPYKTTDHKIAYGNYATAKGKLPTMKLLNGETLDFADSFCEVNLYGGTIVGDVYGGGYGYSARIPVERALDQAGYLFGRSYVNLNGGVVKGNVYGGGAGSAEFYNQALAKYNEATTEEDRVLWAGKMAVFSDLANVYGNTDVRIRGGIVEGHVYAGSKGMAGFPKMATLYGNTGLVIENVEASDDIVYVPIINGNIYGGSELGEIIGDTHVTIRGGAIGNCIFGGSEGIESGADKTTAHITGSTNLTITDGTYFTHEHIAKISADNHLQLTPADRTFNIYGGGHRNCIIDGSTNVNITKSLLTSYKCLIEGRNFEDCVNDETYRKFSVYGAGRGELTDVKEHTNVTINITGGASVPSSIPVDVANGQQFFMIAGGGMAGHVWKNANVYLDGNVFARRIYGAGMYGNVLGDANMTVRRGSYYGVFGGGLLGNVQGNANLTIGTKAGKDEIDPNITVAFEDAADANRNLYIYNNVYGGNDVSGSTGYDIIDKLWNDGNYETFYTLDGIQDESDEVKSHHYLFEHWSEKNNGKPYYRHLIKASENKGVNMKIYGGKILGNVFGAGNGNHTGYYVPNMAESESHTVEEYEAGTITRMKFYEGLPYHYRVNKKDANSYEGTPTYDQNTNTYTGTLKSVLDEDIRRDYGLYEYRPRVGKVVMHIGGNSESDRVEISGDVYGGGHACTIGKYDPARAVLTDPLRFEGGGSLTMNFGSHVTVKNAVYMGSRGRIIGQQTVKGEHNYNGITLNSDMDYHYYDHDQNRYLLGFPNTLEGRKRFHAYMQLVNMDATTELSFYDQTDNTESKDVRWGRFFAGGARGSMTKLIDATHPAYEYTLPAGLTIESCVVGGSEDAEITYYDYKSKTGEDAFTEINENKKLFTFYGGIVYDSHDPKDGNHFGGGRVEWHEVDENDKDRIVGDESPRGSLVVMKLNVNCQFDPQKAEANNADWDVYKDLTDKGDEVESDGQQYWGGLVYGGCYHSGITNGSVEVTCTGTLLGQVDAGFDEFQDYLTASSLRRNVARVYGGGFGEKSTILGNTKVTLDGSFKGFNIFGGGMMGDVTGGTEINVQGGALVYNAVYGGGMLGKVGKNSYTTESDKDLYAKGTHINLISGGIDRVYGGAFMGEVFGGTHITASDEKEVIAAGETGKNIPVRLMVGSIYGGNDITGTIHKGANNLSTSITVEEKPSAKKIPENRYYLTSESKTEKGKFYSGYPMIGTIYGAGNGDMNDYIKGVTIDRDNQRYNGGKVHIANGNGADYKVFDMAVMKSPLPSVETTKIDIKGGTIINVYGGGSMCTATEADNVIVQYADTVARAAFLTGQNDEMTWGILRLFEDLQKSEVTEILGLTDDGKPDFKKDTYTRFSHQIYRVFGGNNLMDMAIQPDLDLKKGYIFSVYSGGNFGKMTYKNPAATLSAGEARGLSLTINSPDIHIASVYGGGRVGDIDAGVDFGDNEYGATLNIIDGLIGDVYGGNNVAGNVRNGTNVNIHGAISGNVYGSGNGNYIYQYDYDNTRGDVYRPGYITEGYDGANGGRYFILPKKIAYYDGSTPVYYGDSDEEKILAINSYRPNVEKAFLNIEGTETSNVYVLGNVYCGGNSSTVLYNPESANGGNIRFHIGSYVALGGVFLGSNGEGLADAFNITYLSNLNGINNWAANNNIVGRTGFADKTKTHYNDQLSYDTNLYPNLLSLYMRAAEVTALPTDFSLPTDAVNAYIGNFCLGGNRGSMMTDKTIELTLPENLTIFGRIVGGCYNSRVEFGEAGNRAMSLGGMTKPLAQKKDSNGALVVDANNNPVYYTNKVDLTIKSKFRPWRLLFNETNNTVSLVNDRTDFTGNYVPDAEVSPDSTYYYREGLCNIFGGCFTSGKTVGGINIDLYSDVLGYYGNNGSWTSTNGRKEVIDREILMNNVALRRTVYAITGAGYGPQTEVEGNVHLSLLPKETTETTSFHPSISTIFGGSHDGQHIGNSTIEVRDGMVFSNIYGGSRAAYKYGSSEIIVGYPNYYICKESGEFTLDRADQVSYVAQATQRADSTLTLNGTQTYKARNHDKTEVIKQTVKYKAGDIVAANVYEQINDANKSTKFDKIDNVTPATFSSSWNNISINIGDNSAMNNTTAHFYGGGGIYGGGHALNESGQSYSGINTQLAFTKDFNPENSPTSTSIGYGGNSTIAIGDNPAYDKDHISIGTGHYVPVKLKKGEDRIGLYKEGTDGFIHMSAGILGDNDVNADGTSKVTYYRMDTEGGVFGDGRRTFVEKFRAVDITGYGYADYTPQSAKLINTFQRIDILSLNDCCLQLQGAQDYATNAIDNTIYSIARIGEIRMNSSLNNQATIEQSVKDGENLGNMSLNKKKSRNYMGFFRNVHYVGALYSNTSFDSDYRGNNGSKVTGTTYKDFKKGYITNYETDKDETKFKPRNLGTAPNMVGINNGYTLNIQNVFTTPAEGAASSEQMLSAVPKDNIYYGPIVGVVEVKLLTVQADEGGGYIYAFNQHEDDATKTSKKGFLEETGNFVFAARAYDSNDTGDENYIIDDCYPLSYYANDSHANDEEVHYWYVQGHKYFFNTTLTGYTYGKPIDFYLDNSDALILLSGITEDNAKSIEVESITWRDHTTEGYKSALKDNLNTSGTDSREDYQLLLTIDSETEKAYTLANPEHAFVAQIPNGNAPDAYGTDAAGKIQVNNSYGVKDGGVKNTPLLGIHLHDKDTLNNRPAFYDQHLSKEDNVVIKIKALESGDPNTGTDIWNYYTINLTIDYLQGPYIDGTVNIENCALPGEYIYANTEGITMEMAEELTVTGMKWFLYPKQKRSGENTYFWDKSQKVEVTKYIQEGVMGNRLQLPARFYQNDWQLDFVVVVNGQEFGLNNSAMEVPRLTIHNYHRMSTVAKAVKQFGGSNTEYGYDLDLDLVSGALVYIESDKDFEIFTKYVNYCNSYRTSIANEEKVEGYEYKIEDGVVWQKDKNSNTENWAKVRRAEVLPGFNRNGGITNFKDNSTILGYDDDDDVILCNVKNPSGAENIRFVLTTDIETTSGCMSIGQFRGRLIGNGYTINFKSGYQNSNFIDENYGEINYVGFVSSGGADATGYTTAVVFDNYGRVNNCFYYNYLKPGAAGYNNFAADIPDFGRTNDAAFIGENYASLVQNIKHKVTGETSKQVHWYGSVDNCYQNSDMAQANALNVDAKKIRDYITNNSLSTAHEIRGNLSYRSSQSFHNGMIAYNLNQEYLKARWKSHDTDELVREQITASYVDENDNYVGGDFLYNNYADGAYRYAYVYDATAHPEALRLASNEDGWPNYEDRLGNGQSMHKSSDDVGHDERRWFTTQRNDLVQIDFRGQIIYEEKKETVGETTVTKIVPKKGNTGYFPLYMHDADNTRAPHSDFIFFGQRITADTSEREYYPRRVNYDNRVYRASGMYGSRTDYGYHFNREAEVVVPQTTAIDFTGTLDLKYKAGDAVDNAVAGIDYIGKPQYKERWQFYIKHGERESNYENEKYLSYELNAGRYEKDANGDWTYQEKLAQATTDTIIQHIFYPPLLDLPGGDHPAMLHNILSLKVDSNREGANGKLAIDDHSHVTKNILIYTPAVGSSSSVTSSTGATTTTTTTYEAADEARLFNQFHYTRMHRWGDVDGETKQDKIIGHHLRWVDHSKDAKLNSHFHAVNGLFHLVDRQDFNAPIDFYVADDVNSSQSTNGRAWLLRQPKGYSLRNKTVLDKDGNPTGFIIGKDAWESIALPFTANRVWAVNSKDYIEKYSRGQITHFYGKDETYTVNGKEKTSYGETHHDYWLRGLVGTAKDNYNGDNVIASAGFARPGNKADGLFQVEGDISGDGIVTDLQMTGDYAYNNNWLYESYKDVKYSSTHNEYNEPLLFKNYRYLTKNAPYIIAFPGCPEDCLDKDGNEDFGYYEFDLSGNFYNKTNNSTGCNPQEILYEFTVEQIDSNNNFDSDAQNVRIPVTDLYEAVRSTYVEGTDGTKTTHLATFKRIAISDKNGVDEDLYVLNDGTETAADANGCLKVRVKDNSNVLLPPGSAFINCKDFGISEILPFRTYLKVELPASSPSPRFVMIGDGTRSIESVEEEQPEKQFEGVQIFVRGNDLVITSDHDFECPLHGYSGQLYRRLSVKRGENVYHGLSRGVYIALGHKFIIRR